MNVVMNAEIRRTARPEQHQGDSLSGQLVIDGVYICDTEENARTALPTGEYRLVRHHCKQYNRFMPVIGIPRCEHCKQLPDEDMNLNTTMPCYCPMLKPGNGVHKREDGSIILGTRIVPGCLRHPLQAFDPLAERIRKAISRNTVITLKITEQ